jgi:hypothetical protein
MVSGKLLHHVLRDVLPGDEVFRDAGFEVECSVPVEGCPGWVLKGKADVVTVDGVYEFKFMRGLEFNRASPAYYAQVSAYAFMLGKVKAYLCLVDRESWDIQVLEAEPDVDLWSNMQAEARLLVESLSRDEVPKLNSPRLGEWECENCAFHVVCKNLKEVPVVESV